MSRRRPDSRAAAAGRPARFAGFVMTYRRPRVLAHTLETLLAQSRAPELLVVVDNEASPTTEEVVASFPADRVAYRPMAENLGPAGAAEAGLQTLVEGGFDWIYWGDDDDPPRAEDDLEVLLDLARGGGSELGGVALSGVRWSWSRGEPVRVPDRELRGRVPLDAVPGGSQLILSRQAVLATGWPDARLFWGLEDYEYCLRLRRQGYGIHAPGDRMLENRRRAGRLDLSPDRSPMPGISPGAVVRAYYSTRNYLFLMRETFDRPDLARRRMAKEVARSASSWLRGPRFGAAYTAWQARAVRDARAGRMGRTVSLDGSKGDSSSGEAP